ncbi:PPE domain-containing protein [Mycolicibacillus parakoreensis]|uniref:PPE family protein n=1 Tax=Mycolicibacillus parakoreensis TaxID=1069221 RepID=A0ABY3TYH9_9MYCO|nr:PPE domain-containing protein [Mycolicibacillus parakoreensis]MCV7316549.1 PPE domain-containing protein [Mycolicibacillus parakoreensis]ULN52773.1 PPE family protein [Mycolicibacillus parakoreensis]
MADPRWAGPPELIAATFEAGPGPASTVANQAVWLAEAVGREVVAAVSTANTAATSGDWIGLGATASAARATGLNLDLATLAGWIAHKVAITQAAADAFAVAASGVIPSVVCQANRDQWAVLNATNFLGLNTPAIVALDTEYFGEHYPHNAGLGWAYSAALTALTAALALPPPVGMPGAAAAGPGAAGAQVGTDAAGMLTDGAAAAPVAAPALDAGGSPAAGVGDLGSTVGELAPLVNAVAQPVQRAVEVPAHLAQSAAGAAQPLTGVLSGVGGGMFGSAGQVGGPAAGPVAAEPVRLGGAAAPAVAGTGPVAPVGLTRYTQPTSSFAPENAGRPGGLGAGLLSAPTPGAGTRAAPVPIGAGMPIAAAGAAGRDRDDTGAGARVRVVAEPERPGRSQ